MAKTSDYSTSHAGLKADVLLVTATDVEAQAVRNIFPKEPGGTFEPHFIDNLTYFDLGFISGARAFMVRSEMGAGGPSGATLTINEGIQVLAPSAVIMVGIAFGVDPRKQRIGDILVSRQLLGYELQRIGKNGAEVKIIQRGDRPQASPRLLDRFHTGVLGWSGQKVEFGLVLSGDKLVDGMDFRNQLLRFAPDAIGGEMEGTGLYAAAQRKKVDWILVKAICDWADGNKGYNKRARQQQAAENAVSFVLHVLRQGGFNQNAAGSSTLPQEEQKAQPLGKPLCYDIHSSWVVVVAWEPNGNRIASAGGDGTVRVWDADEGRSLLTYRGHSRRLARAGLPPTIYNIAWSPEGLRIASAGDGAQVRVWDATTGHNLAIYQGHTGFSPNVYALSWSPDGTRIASACSIMAGTDKTVHIWDVVTGKTLLRCNASQGLKPNFSVLAVAWSPDGTRIAAACYDTIRVWHTANGHLISVYQSNSAYVNDIVWSPDSTKIATANDNHTVQVWDSKTSENILTYYGHTGSVRDVAWSPDGARIASAGNDKTVQIWNSATGKLLFSYPGHSDWTTAVAWSPDGSLIASASNDKTVQIWQANQGI
ncbi:MAG: hypothetical protein JOZ18_04110 [Chloroflexi bacterium]|nr:hypothetical protein [Chloroflexota bacterium]